MPGRPKPITLHERFGYSMSAALGDESATLIFASCSPNLGSCKLFVPCPVSFTDTEGITHTAEVGRHSAAAGRRVGQVSALRSPNAAASGFDEVDVFVCNHCCH